MIMLGIKHALIVDAQVTIREIVDNVLYGIGVDLVTSIILINYC